MNHPIHSVVTLPLKADGVSIMGNLFSRFDVILIDVPAFSTGADALTIAARIGGILLVCRNNSTGIAEIKVVGSVLTDF